MRLICGFLPMLLAVSALNGQTATDLRIVHFNVGNGDATLVVALKGSTILKSLLIDGGSRAKACAVVIPGLRQEGIEMLDYAVATHRSREHSEGLQTVIDTIPMSGKGGCYDRDRIWSPPGAPKIEPGKDLPFAGDVTVKCVAANGRTESWDGTKSAIDENSKSVVFKITFHRFTYFVGGDLTGGGRSGWRFQEPDMETPVARDTDQISVLRINHHGSPSSSNVGFLGALNPMVAIISADQPSPDYLLDVAVINRLLKLARLSAVYITGATDIVSTLSKDAQAKVKAGQGNIVITTNGIDSFQVNGTPYKLPK